MKHRCDGVGRREVLQIGALGPLGLLLPQWTAAREIRASASRAKSCILIWLDGGPSHLETFDPKTNVPEEVRGPFAPLATRVTGIQISELMPQTATVVDKLAIIRSMTSPLGEHGLAHQYLLTGYPPSPVLQYPSYGAVLSHMRGGVHTLPPNIVIPEMSRAGGAGFLGSAHEPFAVGGDPAQQDFQVRDAELFRHLTLDRIDRRREYLNRFEQLQADFEKVSPSTDPTFEQAYRLVTSPEAKQAFRLSEEPAEIRSRYGPRTLGQSCLLARRLVERGVPFVTVFNSGWDTHEDLVLRLRDGYTGAKVGVGLVPTFDQAFATLIAELDDRGMLEETLVIAMGEFGRTPKLNTRGGRDHWPRVFSAVAAGAGIAGGQIVGSSDRTGESPADRPVTPADLACSIYHLLGIDPAHELHTSDGRPIRVSRDGQLIDELVG